MVLLVCFTPAAGSRIHNGCFWCDEKVPAGNRRPVHPVTPTDVSERKLNYLFVFITILLFVLEASVAERYVLLTALGLSTLVAFPAFFLGFLTLDGVRAAVIAGMVTYGFGGIEAALVIVAFFVSSNSVGPLFGSRNLPETPFTYSDRRTGTQVWANAFWFVLFICLWFVLKADMFLIAAYASMATANADTWATEIGIRRKNARTVLITTRLPVERGTNGGVSVPGFLAAFLGAAFIGLIAIVFDHNFAIISFVAITIAGFAGSVVDSVIGAVYQHTGKRVPILVFRSDDGDDDNSSVNFIATGIGAILGLIIYNLLLYGLV